MSPPIDTQHTRSQSSYDGQPSLRPPSRPPSIRQRIYGAFLVFTAAVLTIALAAAMLLVLASMVSCGATERVSQNASKITALANDALTRAQAASAQARADANSTLVTESPALAAGALNAAADALDEICGPIQDISASAGVIQDQVPKLQDRTPFWQKALIAICVLLSIGGVIYLMTVTGAWAVCRAAVGWLLALLPHPQVTKAKLDMEALEESPSNVELNSAVALRRGQSPVYNAAWKRLKQKKDLAVGRAVRTTTKREHS